MEKVVARGWGRRNKMLFNEYKVLQDKTVLKIDGEDGCITFWMYLTILSCTPKHGDDSKFYVMCILLHLKSTY